MNTNRIWMLSCIMLIGAIIAGGYFVGISPLLAAAASADETRAGVEQQNVAYAADLESLKVEFEKLDDREAELAAARLVVPMETADGAFVGELHELQASTGAVVVSFNVSDPKAYVPVVTELPAETAADGTAPPAEGEAGAEGSTDAAAPSTTTADTTPAAVSTPAVPGAELMTAESFVAIPYSVSVMGTLEQTEAYVEGLQAGSRLFLVTKLTLTLDDSTGLFTQDIDGYIWVYRSDAGGATTSDPAADTATVSN